MQGQNRPGPPYMMQPGPTQSQVVVVGAGGRGGSNPIQQRNGAPVPTAGNGGIHHPGEVGHTSTHSKSNGGNIPPRVLTQPTPLFERLVTEEVQELKAYARIIENQNRRLAELERVHGDLEARLELESRGRAQLETTLEEREREWAIKFRELEADRDRWKSVVKVEQTKNARLIDQVVRKDQGLHRMLQRKYDKEREPSGVPHAIRNVRPIVSERQSSIGPDAIQRVEGQQHFKSPHEILSASGSMETVRIRNVKNLLMDFFAM